MSAEGEGTWWDFSRNGGTVGNHFCAPPSTLLAPVLMGALYIAVIAHFCCPTKAGEHAAPLYSPAPSLKLAGVSQASALPQPHQSQQGHRSPTLSSSLAKAGRCTPALCSPSALWKPVGVCSSHRGRLLLCHTYRSHGGALRECRPRYVIFALHSFCITTAH